MNFNFNQSSQRPHEHQNFGRNFAPGSGTSEQSLEGTGVKNSSRVDGRCTGTKERSNIGGSSGTTPTRSCVGNPSRGVGFPTCKSSPVGLESVREVFVGSSHRSFARTWGMHQRDASGLSGRSRVVPVVVLSQRRLRQRNAGFLSGCGGATV